MLLKTKAEKTNSISKKTEKTETMKTKINHFVIASIFSLLFIGGNAKAEGTEFIFSNDENSTESALDVENWMVNEIYWNNFDAVYFIDQVSEENLELENWMTDETAWQNKEAESFKIEIETGLELESWMLNEKVWNTK